MRQTPRTFAATMRARQKGDGERIVLAAHTGEAMARQKILKSPDHYLRPLQRAAPDPSAVAAMMNRMARSGMAVRVRRIPAKERAAFNGGRNTRLS